MQPRHKAIDYSTLGFLTLLIFIFLATMATVLKKNTVLADEIKFTGKILEAKDLSGIGLVDKYILIGADEGSTIQVLEPNKKRSKYRVAENIQLWQSDKSEVEIDIEGIAVANNTVYVIGSHSVNKATQEKAENYRYNVFSFELNPDTGRLHSEIDRSSLQAILEQDEILNQYVGVPHDDNGIDIEGVAVQNERLYFGFRTPILQDSYVPVIVVRFKDLNRTDKYELRHVNLGGNSIRDLVAVEKGFLILADDQENDSRDFQVYFWDGSNNLSKVNRESTKFLSKIPTKKNTKAEGLTILKETNSKYRILVVYDGVKEGDPTILEIAK